jgi:putative flippase GtrA
VANLAEIAREFATSPQQRYVLVRFLAIGASFALLYSTLSSALAIGFHVAPALASALAYAACVPPAYLAQRNLAFRADAPHRRAFPRYVMLQAPLLLLGAALSWLLIDRLSWPEALSFFLIGPSVAMVSFVAQRLWTFAKR